MDEDEIRKTLAKQVTKQIDRMSFGLEDGHQRLPVRRGLNPLRIDALQIRQPLFNQDEPKHGGLDVYGEQLQTTFEDIAPKSKTGPYMTTEDAAIQSQIDPRDKLDFPLKEDDDASIIDFFDLSEVSTPDEPETDLIEQDMPGSGAGSDRYGEPPLSPNGELASHPKAVTAGHDGVSLRGAVVLMTILGASTIQGLNTSNLNLPEEGIVTWLANCTERLPLQYDDAFLLEHCQLKTVDAVAQMWALVVSIFSVGGIIGGLLVAFVVMNFGETNGLMMSGVISSLGSILQFSSKYVDSRGFLVLGRFLVGISSGLNSGMVTMFLTEIAPSKYKGAYGALYRFSTTVAILASLVLGMEGALGNEQMWPFLLGVTLVPSLPLVFFMPFLPNSPAFLYLHKREVRKARRALQYYRPRSALIELERLHNFRQHLQKQPKFATSDIVLQRSLLKPLLLSWALMAVHQVTGMKIILYFSKKVLQESGVSSSRQTLETLTLSLGATNLVCTFLIVLLADRVGRKTLLLVGLTGMYMSFMLVFFLLNTREQLETVAESPGSTGIATVVLLMTFVGFYAIGPGPVPWYMYGEFFRINVRPTATSLAVSINFFGSFIMGIIYPLIRQLGHNLFILFGFVQLTMIILIILCVPETRHKTQEEILAKFK